jgi:hypothetical protein
LIGSAKIFEKNALWRLGRDAGDLTATMHANLELTRLNQKRPATGNFKFITPPRRVAA